MKTKFHQNSGDTTSVVQPGTDTINSVTVTAGSMQLVVRIGRQLITITFIKEGHVYVPFFNLKFKEANYD